MRLGQTSDENAAQNVTLTSQEFGETLIPTSEPDILDFDGHKIQCKLIALGGKVLAWAALADIQHAKVILENPGATITFIPINHHNYGEPEQVKVLNRPVMVLSLL